MGWERSCDIHLRASIIGTTAASRRRSAAGPILSRPTTAGLLWSSSCEELSRVPTATSVSGSCAPCCLRDGMIERDFLRAAAPVLNLLATDENRLRRAMIHRSQVGSFLA